MPVLLVSRPSEQLVGRAVLGSALGRETSRETVAACDRWLAELRQRRAALAAALGLLEVDQGPSGDGRVLHRCPDSYQSVLALAECCEACGWSPSLPLPVLAHVADRLVHVLGRRQAVTWARALVTSIDKARP